MSDTGSIELSRRRVLGGLGAVGVASAGAALGTSAYFSDEESFDDNVLTAGSLDLLVDYYSYWDQGMAGTGSVTGTANGEAVSAELADVKPGDSGLVALCPRIDDNPAYLWLRGALTANDENGRTEPEAEVDDSGGDPGLGDGELAQNVDVAVRYCELGAIGDEFDPGDVQNATEIWTGSLADFLPASQGGLALDGTGTVPQGGGFPAAGEQACFDGTSAESSDNPCLCLDWTVPTDVGNEIQGDSLAFDLQLYAEQCRHNDGTNNPFADSITLYAPDASARGFATTTDRAHSGQGAWQSQGSNKETLYLGPEFAPFDRFGSFTVGEIEEISYHTWKQVGTSGSEPENFYVEIYTEPQGGPVDTAPGTDDGSWYNKRLNAEPYFADGLNAPGAQWNEWSTADDGTNELWFFDANRPNQGYGWYGSHPSFDDLTSGPINWSNYGGGSSQTVDYAAQTVKTIAISTGSGWTDQFDGLLDDVTVTLTGGETLHVDLEQ